MWTVKNNQRVKLKRASFNHSAYLLQLWLPSPNLAAPVHTIHHRLGPVFFSKTMTVCRALNNKLADTASQSSSRFLAHEFGPIERRSLKVSSGCVRYPARTSSTSVSRPQFPLATHASLPAVTAKPQTRLEAVEEGIEKVIYRCRFMAFLGTLGSLLGSVLCFIKGCTFVVASFMEYFVNRAKVILLLVEAIDVYLLGTVMLVFGMGLYELFVSNLDTSKSVSDERVPHRSNLFGLFTLKERPRWLEIKSVRELKTKLGHVIVMLLLIGWFDKSKKAVIHSVTDLLCFSVSILLSSGCLFLLSKLNDTN